MPKRVGYVWEELISEDNINLAIKNALRRKKKTSMIRHIQKNVKEYGERTRETIINGWEPDPIRYKTINESSNKKTRDLKIPSLRDHFVHTAVAQILEKYLTKRFYFYSCGSLPNRGQTFAVKAIEKQLRRNKPKYAALADVRKFYDSVKKEQVMKCLRRVFKDEKFLEINEKILSQMGDGLAIGFTVSHWYAHLVLSYMDHFIKEGDGRTFLCRFMDNIVMLGSNKRSLHKKLILIRDFIGRMGLVIKHDWQVFPIRCRMIEFLSYRLNHDKTILRKGLMYRLAKRFRHAANNLDAHTARVIMSDRGILKHCDSFNFRKSYLYPNVSIELCRRLISNADKKRALCRAA